MPCTWCHSPVHLVDMFLDEAGVQVHEEASGGLCSLSALLHWDAPGKNQDLAILKPTSRGCHYMIPQWGSM